MTQKYHHGQQLQAPMAVNSYLHKTIMSLDNMQIGNVIGEEGHNMVITDSDNGNRFTIPVCKVISIDDINPNNLIVDLEYQEAGRYNS